MGKLNNSITDGQLLLFVTPPTPKYDSQKDPNRPTLEAEKERIVRTTNVNDIAGAELVRKMRRDKRGEHIDDLLKKMVKDIPDDKARRSLEYANASKYKFKSVGREPLGIGFQRYVIEQVKGIARDLLFYGIENCRQDDTSDYHKKHYNSMLENLHQRLFLYEIVEFYVGLFKAKLSANQQTLKKSQPLVKPKDFDRLFIGQLVSKYIKIGRKELDERGLVGPNFREESDDNSENKNIFYKKSIVDRFVSFPFDELEGFRFILKTNNFYFPVFNVGVHENREGQGNVGALVGVTDFKYLERDKQLAKIVDHIIKCPIKYL